MRFLFALGIGLEGPIIFEVGQWRSATQMPATATFWNRCGDATAEDGYDAIIALNSGCVNAARKLAVDSHTA